LLQLNHPSTLPYQPIADAEIVIINLNHCNMASQRALQPDSRAESAEKRIHLQHFSEQITVWPEDDWSGISDPKQRRRLQIRLNQRVLREFHYLGLMTGKHMTDIDSQAQACGKS
jgi:hypothetical protein